MSLVGTRGREFGGALGGLCAGELHTCAADFEERYQTTQSVGLWGKMILARPTRPRLSCRSPNCFQPLKHLESFIGSLVASPRPSSVSSTRFRKTCSSVAPRNYLNQHVLRSTQKKSVFQSQQAFRAYATAKFQPIRLFEDLPSHYNDSEGLAFRDKPLSASEVNALFGGNIDAANANKLLRILQGRRVAGTLADPSLPAPIPRYDIAKRTVALSWLRRNIPVDERASAGLRAELELEELAKEDEELSKELAEAKKATAYLPNSDESLKGTKGKNSLYGRSGLDEIRLKKEKELDEFLKREKEQEEERLRNQPVVTGELATRDPQSGIMLRRKGENPLLKHFLERAKVLPDVPPEMSVFKRLWPSALVVLAVVGASILFAKTYTPPAASKRLWPDIPPAAATILGIIGINTFIWVAWRFPPAFRYLNMYFMSVPGYPRALAVIGNVFSHQTITHLAMNMGVLWLMGTRLHDDVGRANFLALYLSAGALSSFGSLAYYAVTKNFATSSLGASGAVSGIVAAYIWLHLNDSFRIFGIIPPEPTPGIPGTLVLAGVVGVDLYGLVRKRSIVKVKMDHIAHLGGYASGVAGMQMYLRSREKRRKEEEERRKNMGITDRIKSWRP
jgi:rhomboid-like protein